MDLVRLFRRKKEAAPKPKKDLVRLFRRKKEAAPKLKKAPPKPKRDLLRLLRRKKKTPSKPKAQPLTKTGTIRGTVSYPWGTVGYAAITVGDRSTVADAAGRYETLVVNLGEHNVAAKAPFPGYEARAQNLTVAAGETKDVDFYLDFEKAPVHGHVYGQDGKPIAGATLSGVIWLGGGKDSETVVTDDKGFFSFENVSPGNQFIRVNAAGHVGETRDFQAKKGEETKLEFHLTPAGFKIHGTVLDENDHPLSAAIVLSSALGIILEKTSSNAETGHYELPVVPGFCAILVIAPQYEPKGWRGQISSDETLDFKLEPGVARRHPTQPSMEVTLPPPDERPLTGTDRSPWNF